MASSSLSILLPPPKFSTPPLPLHSPSASIRPSPSRFSTTRQPLVRKDGRPERKRKEEDFPAYSLVAPRKEKERRGKKEARVKASAATVTQMLAEKVKKMQWAEALEVFDMLRQQPFYQPKEGAYMNMLVLLGKCGQATRAHEVFDTMVQEGIKPTTELYTALIAAYCRSNLVDGAITVLNKMKTLPHCEPDIYTYSTVIKACVGESLFKLVDSLFKEMADQGITPNIVTWNTLLNGYGKAGKFDMIEEIVSAMLVGNICKPDVWTMNTTLGIYSSKGDIDMMEKWYEKFRSIGIEPETRTFNILIGAYGKRKMYDKMSTVMEYMRKLAFPWTTSTYNNVIEAFADVGDAENMEDAFNQMCAERMKADTKTFRCLINGFSNAGLFHKVVSSIKLAEKLEIPTNTSYYNAVISACAKAGDLPEMERVFNHMKTMHHIPDSGTYSTMIEAYENEGMTDKIYDLEKEKLPSSVPR